LFGTIRKLAFKTTRSKFGSVSLLLLLLLVPFSISRPAAAELGQCSVRMGTCGLFREPSASSLVRLRAYYRRLANSLFAGVPLMGSHAVFLASS
jgi:hypothetical protein